MANGHDTSSLTVIHHYCHPLHEGSCQPSGHTSPILRTEEIQIFPSGYPQVQGYPVKPAQVSQDMNKQQPVAEDLMPAPSVAAPQQQGQFQQQQAGLRTQSGGQVPIAQPPRPPSGSGMVSSPTGGILPKRYRKPILIIDPNTGQQVQTETESKTTPPSGSARHTPVGRQVTERSPPPQCQQHSTQDIAAQFAAQVAATLKPNHSAHTEEASATDFLPQTKFTDETGALPPEFVTESHSVEATDSLPQTELKPK